jgi:hypothetical protein
MMSLEAAVELAKEMQELYLLFRCEQGEEIGNHAFVLGYDDLEETSTLVGQVESVGAAILLADEPPAGLHSIEQLAHVAFGYEKRIRQLLLRRPFGRTNFCQHVELRHAERAAAKMVCGVSLDFLKDAHQPHPAQHCGRASATRSGACGWR